MLAGDWPTGLNCGIFSSFPRGNAACSCSFMNSMTYLVMFSLQGMLESIRVIGIIIICSDSARIWNSSLDNDRRFAGKIEDFRARRIISC